MNEVTTEVVDQQADLPEATDGRHLTDKEAQFLGKEPVKLVQLADGSIATQAEVAASMAQGQDPSGPYDGGSR